MSIGNQPTLQQLDQMLTADAVTMRNDCQGILNRWKTIQFIGVAGLQAAPYNMSATDAQNYYNGYNYLQTIAQVWFGTATQATDFNFDNELGVTLGLYGGN